MRCENSNNTLTFGVGILVGALVGIVVASVFILVIKSAGTVSLSAPSPLYVPITKSLREHA